MPPYSKEYIKQYLISRDKHLVKILNCTPFPAQKRNPDVYLTLLHSIASQQLSVKAANTIFTRVLSLFDDGYPHPEILVKMSDEKLRNAGLSMQKSGYLKDVARFSLRHGMEFKALQKLSDTDIINHLTQIKGVGQWTVEMILMFSLNRKDVFSADDLGIQAVMKTTYQLKTQGKLLKSQMHEIAEHWRPFRTVVCKFMWQWKAVN